MDALPVVSQVKSAVQWLWGDSEGAYETQVNFTKKFPVVSQVRSAGFALVGNQKEARKTQMEFLGNLDGIPVVGHAKV